ncbi:MAG: hypothetical protein GF409_06335 [Candidatus Omnitrophica bacterium]|nr:hypothetical protein [Candidatus Omnitrophota bacterium]
MKFHPEEYKSAEEYWEDRPYPRITDEQYRKISEKAGGLVKFPLDHPYVHHLINIAVLVFIFLADWWVLIRLGGHFASPVASGLVIGLLHSYLMYSLIVYTMHEGTAHKLIFRKKNPALRFLGSVANNLGRIASAEVDHYAKKHLEHHAHFQTPQDGEFLGFIYPRRLYKTFIPYASLLNFADFRVHAGMGYSPSRLLSLAIFLLYHGTYAYFMSYRYSWLVIVISMVLITPNVTFWLDRLRQYTEHNTQPLDRINGGRDLGRGFWGMLIGGGPWGQPCHWTHHLYPGVPWYGQLRLHGFVRKLLNREQRDFFMLRPVTGYPLTLYRIIKDTGKYQKPFSEDAS